MTVRARKWSGAPVESVAVSEIIVDVPFRRREKTGAIDPLAESMARVGLINPIVVSSENVLVVGERRLIAARQLGWTEIPARRFRGITRKEIDRISRAENVERENHTEPGDG